MPNKKNLINILLISLLLSVCIIASVGQLLVEEENSSNLAVSVIYLFIWIMVIAVTFVTGSKALLLFSLGYHGLSFLIWSAVLILSEIGISFTPLYFLICVFFYPLLGFGILIDYGQFIILIIHAVLALVSFHLYRKILNK
ncbi:MAG: hypothetical protein U0M06_00980 [Clostridia bacterium]|nr:hypothetical protein [Clostridia bacterium]